MIAQRQKSRVGHLIFNPVSGQGNPDQDLSLIRRLLEPQVHLNVILTNEQEDPAEQAKVAITGGAKLIIASDGDGTISAFAGSVVNTDIPLGSFQGGQPIPMLQHWAFPRILKPLAKRFSWAQPVSSMLLAVMVNPLFY